MGLLLFVTLGRAKQENPSLNLIATFPTCFTVSLIFTSRVNNLFEQVFRLIINALKAYNELCIHANASFLSACVDLRALFPCKMESRAFSHINATVLNNGWICSNFLSLFPFTVLLSLRTVFGIFLKKRNNTFKPVSNQMP